MTDPVRPRPEAIEACHHQNFAARVDVNRLEDIGKFTADVSVQCAECGLEFSFLGFQHAISVERPVVNIDATTVTLPIEPGPKPIPLLGTIPVEIPRKPSES